MIPSFSPTAASTRDLLWQDAFRFRPDGESRPGHREWHHFCILADGLDILLNLSVLAGQGARPSAGQVTVLVRHDRWSGAFERLAMSDIDLRTNHLEASFGPSSLRFDGDYDVRVVVPEKRISVRARLRPLARPFIAHNVDPTGGATLSWLVVPRLAAAGEVEIGDRRWSFRGAPAYHDHNWGEWGSRRVWDWGFGLSGGAEGGAAAVFVRLCDPRRTEVHVQGLFLWDGAELVRVVRDSDLRFIHEGFLRVPRLVKVPPALGILAPGDDTGAPERLEINYDDSEERGTLRFTAEDAAQVLAPGERHPELFVINEVSARFELEGTLRGRPVRASGRGIFEHVTA